MLIERGLVIVIAIGTSMMSYSIFLPIWEVISEELSCIPLVLRETLGSILLALLSGVLAIVLIYLTNFIHL